MAYSQAYMRQVVDANGTSKHRFLFGKYSTKSSIRRFPAPVLFLMRCLPQNVAGCGYLLLGWANVYGLATRDGGFAAVDAGKGAADAAGGDGDVGHAQCIVYDDGQCRVLNTMLLYNADRWALEFLQGSGIF